LEPFLDSHTIAHHLLILKLTCRRASPVDTRCDFNRYFSLLRFDFESRISVGTFYLYV